MIKNISEHKWIPWRRYVLFLRIDNSKKKKIGRAPRRDLAIRAARRLMRYRGYEPEIFDTKRQTTVCHGIVNHEIDLPVLRQ